MEVGEIIDYILRNGLSTPRRVYEALEIYFKRGVMRYYLTSDGVEGIVLGGSGAVHIVRISVDGYRCSCGDSRSNHYLCKHAIALLYQVLTDKRIRDRALEIIARMLGTHVVLEKTSIAV